MASRNQAPTVQTQTMQGQTVPVSSVNPLEFARATRRQRFQQYNSAWAGNGATDTVKILRTGILSELQIELSGTVTITLGGGTAATTSRWPYDLIKACRFAANGQSQLINVSGLKLKAYEMMRKSDLNDRGVVQAFGGAYPGTSKSQGTLSLNQESWGIGSGVTAIPAAAYSFDLQWIVPIAYDQTNLVGAIFAQTSSTDLTLAIDWAPITDLFVLTGAATAVIAATLRVIGTLFTIPTNPQGGIFIPDLSAFHALQQSRVTPTQGVNELTLIGQGVGRQLLRIFAQTWVGAAPQTIQAVNNTNFGQFGLRFGGNDTPENLLTGSIAAFIQERTFSSDLAGQWGFLSLDFVSEFAFRDAYDEGTASEMRLLLELLGNPTTPSVEYVQETLASGVSA